MPIVLAAAGILMVTMGIRQSTGLLISPINTTTGLGIASISLALAIGQFVWGAAQPVAGALADRYGPGPVLCGGLLLLALGCGLTPLLSDSVWGLTLSMGLLSAMGSGASSFSVLIGAASQRMPAQVRGSASGLINAGGSMGQFVFAPLLQKLIGSIGWMGAIASMALVALATLPLVRTLTGQAPPNIAATVTSATTGSAVADGGIKQAVFSALKDPSYLLLHAGFFTCGFHIAFLVTHLPGEVDLCGLPASVASWSLAIIGLANIAGSLMAGASLSSYRGKHVLAVMYGSRALLIMGYLLMPKTEWTYYLFAAGLGFTWLATVPPTASIVGKLFGMRYLATLFGLTLLSHQIGGFLGAWLGGVALTRLGDYNWMWYADIALSALAALANLPIKEAAVINTTLR
jgi:MFS family permease